MSDQDEAGPVQESDFDAYVRRGVEAERQRAEEIRRAWEAAEESPGDASTAPPLGPREAAIAAAEKPFLDAIREAEREIPETNRLAEMLFAPGVLNLAAGVRQLARLAQLKEQGRQAAEDAARQFDESMSRRGGEDASGRSG